MVIIVVILAGLVSLLLVAYFKGKKDEQTKGLKNSVDDLIKSKKKQDTREAMHDEHMRIILHGPVNSNDASRMLQEWLDKNPPATKTDT